MRKLLVIAVLALSLVPQQAKAQTRDYDRLTYYSQAPSRTKTWADGSWGSGGFIPSNETGSFQGGWGGVVYAANGVPWVQGQWHILTSQVDSPDRDITYSFTQRRVNSARLDLTERHACFYQVQPSYCEQYHRVEVHLEWQHHGWHEKDTRYDWPLGDGAYSLISASYCDVQGTFTIDGRVAPTRWLHGVRKGCSMYWEEVYYPG